MRDLQPYGISPRKDYPKRPISRAAVWSVWVGVLLVASARLSYGTIVPRQFGYEQLTLVPYVLAAMSVSIATAMAAVVGAIRLRGAGLPMQVGWMAAGVAFAVCIPVAIVIENLPVLS